MNHTTNTTEKQSVNGKASGNGEANSSTATVHASNATNTKATTTKASTTSTKKAEPTKHQLIAKRTLAKIIGTDGSCLDRLYPDDVLRFKAMKKEVEDGLFVHTWEDLYVESGMTKNDRIALITDDELIVGVDMASNKMDLRIFDRDGTEFTHRALHFDLTAEGFEQCFNTMVEFAALFDKKQIVFGLEPTGHYWFNTYFNMIQKNVTVLLVNPYAVNRIKEVDTNEQSKSDSKDPAVIARLMKDGAFSIPYLPTGKMKELRDWALVRENLLKEQGRLKNQIHQWVDVYFPEIKSIYKDIDAPGLLVLLKKGLFPADIVKMGEAGVLEIFVENKFKGRREAKAKAIYEAAVVSVGCKHVSLGASVRIQYLVQDLITCMDRLKYVESMVVKIGEEAYPNIAKICSQIKGITEKTLSLWLSDIGDISRFHSAGEIIKLSGLVPVERSSGKWKGISKISKRGRKRSRRHLYFLAQSVVDYDPTFKTLYEYYTTRANNPLKHNQALMAIAAKLVRVLLTLLKTGADYDPNKLLNDIKRPQKDTSQKVAK